MDSFPVELWIGVFRMLRKRDWLALSGTCNMFHEIVKHQLYRDIDVPDDGVERDTAMLFAQSLGKSPSLASLVRTLKIRKQSTTQSTSSFNQVIHRIPFLSNLRELGLDTVYINSYLWAIIGRLPHLHCVSYTRCKIHPTLEFTPETHHGAHIFSVSITHLCEAQGWPEVIIPTLRSLEIGENSKPTLERTLSGLISRHSPRQITTLIINYTIPGNIIEFLLACPQIRKITLPGSRRKEEFSVLCTLPHHALPLLEDFSGFSNYLEAFIIGRRIHSVDIRRKTGDGSRAEALRTLQLSLVPVTSLKIADFMSVDTLQDAPITLQRLYIVEEITRMQTIVWIPSLSRMPNLYTLHVTNVHVPLDEQAALVDTASVTCKSLREFVFDTGRKRIGGWQTIRHTIHTWRWRRDGPWECYSFVDDA